MLGILFGIVCAVAFVGVWRGRFHRGCRGAGFGHRRYARGRFFGLYRLFEELDTSPGQEKAIRSALGELAGSVAEYRPRLKEARHSVAEAFASEAFDAAALDRALETPISEVARSKGALISTLAKIHEALDADQRRRLARFVESLPRGYAC